MRTVQHYIETQSRHLGEHPFFDDIRSHSDLTAALAFAPKLIPWVMSFQDVIRINAELSRVPSIRRQLLQHASEDQGHEVWFLEDLHLLFGDSGRDVSWVFGSETAVTREATLAIASEVFRISDDRLRLVFIEVIEAGAHTFIEIVHQHVQASERAAQLKYFGTIHAAAEAGHEMLNDRTDRHPPEMDLPDGLRVDAIAMVDRIFAAFLRMADGARTQPASTT